LRGWIIYNAFLGTKFTQQAQQLIAAAEKLGVTLEPKASTEVLYLASSEGFQLLSGEALPDFVLFWDKDIRLAQALEGMGVRLFNTSRAIELCDDKSLTHFALQKAGIPMPDTIFVPKTYEGIGYGNAAFLENAAAALSFPIVVKEWFGSFGQQVYLANNLEELYEIVARTAPKPLLLQKMVKSSVGRDVRLNVVGGQVVVSMYRTAKSGDFRSNITNGGSAVTYTPTREETKLAEECCRILGLDFGGVDILFGERGPVVCEVNSNAHMKNIRDVTGIDVAEYIAAHIVREIYGERGCVIR